MASFVNLHVYSATWVRHSDFFVYYPTLALLTPDINSTSVVVSNLCMFTLTLLVVCVTSHYLHSITLMPF